MNISVVKFPGTAISLEIEEGSTVGQALTLVAQERPSMDLTGEIRVNNNTVSENTVLYSGQKIIITKKIKGNAMITVKVTKFPGATVEVAAESGSTVDSVIALASSDLGDVEGYIAKLNGETVDKSAIVADGSRIVLVKKIKGN